MARKRKRESSIVEKVFVQSFFTTVLSTMAFCVGPLVDGMMIGNFMSTDSVAAYGLVGPSIFVFSTVGAVIAGGARNIVSRLIGDGNLENGNRAFSLAVFHSLSISAAMVLITILFSRHITILLGARGSLSELIEPARLYLIGYALGVPASNCSKVISSFMQMDGDGKRVINSVIVMTIVDVIGDILVVFAGDGYRHCYRKLFFTRSAPYAFYEKEYNAEAQLSKSAMEKDAGNGLERSSCRYIPHMQYD